MCTSIVEIAPASGMAKGEDAWFMLSQAVVSYDHARHAFLEDAITIDFVNRDLPPGARAAVELTLESAKALSNALARAIAAAEIEEGERPRSAERIASRANIPQAFTAATASVPVRSSGRAMQAELPARQTAAKAGRHIKRFAPSLMQASRLRPR
jgi:hypothetical protein